ERQVKPRNADATAHYSLSLRLAAFEWRPFSFWHRSDEFSPHHRPEWEWLPPAAMLGGRRVWRADSRRQDVSGPVLDNREIGRGPGRPGGSRHEETGPRIPEPVRPQRPDPGQLREDTGRRRHHSASA